MLAYLDPGSGSMIVQMIVGGTAAAAVGIKLFWRRILAFLRIRKPDDATAKGTAPAEAKADDTA